MVHQQRKNESCHIDWIQQWIATKQSKRHWNEWWNPPKKICWTFVQQVKVFFIFQDPGWDFHWLSIKWHFSRFCLLPVTWLCQILPALTLFDWHLKSFQASGLHIWTPTLTALSVQTQFRPTAFGAYISAEIKPITFFSLRALILTDTWGSFITLGLLSMLTLQNPFRCRVLLFEEQQWITHLLTSSLSIGSFSKLLFNCHPSHHLLLVSTLLTFTLLSLLAITPHVNSPFLTLNFKGHKYIWL